MSSLGYNTGYIEDLYNQYLSDPQSVSESWQEFFADYHPSESFVSTSGNLPDKENKAQDVASGRVPSIIQGGDGAVTDPVHPASATSFIQEDVEIKPLRGAGAKIVENMEESLGVPTATSVRNIPVRLLAENRKLINEYQRYVGGNKVSFTHIVAYAIVKALTRFSNMNSTLSHIEGKPHHIVPKGVNLGLAIDVERRGRRSLMVPNIKDAGSMSFTRLLGTYNDLVVRARDGKLQIADFQGNHSYVDQPGNDRDSAKCTALDARSRGHHRCRVYWISS